VGIATALVRNRFHRPAVDSAMRWDLAFAATATYAKPEHFETFRRHIDATWIEAALSAAGMATERRCRLPIEEVLWIVLGMAVSGSADRRREQARSGAAWTCRDRPPKLDRATARAGLGSEPMECCSRKAPPFGRMPSADAHRWRELAPRNSCRAPCRSLSNGRRSGRRGWVIRNRDPVSRPSLPFPDDDG
jgi:hypothetical protein